MPLVLPAAKLVGMTTGEVPSVQLLPPMAQRMVYVAGGVPTVTGVVQVVDQAVPPVLKVPAVTLCGAEGATAVGPDGPDGPEGPEGPGIGLF